MGNIQYSSGKNKKKQRKNNDDIEEIIKRLRNLENLDKNNDGIITKDELEQFKKEQTNDISSFKKEIEHRTEIKYHDLLIKSERKLNGVVDENNELKKQLNALTNINKILDK